MLKDDGLIVASVHLLLAQDSVDAFPDMDNFYGGDGGPTIRSLMEVLNVLWHISVVCQFK